MISQRAKHLRKQAKLSLRYLAERVGTSASTLSRFENGNLDVSLKVVLKLFDELGEPLTCPDSAVDLSGDEREYIFLLTALDAMRISAMSEEGQDYHYRVRHSLRSKLFEASKAEASNEHRR